MNNNEYKRRSVKELRDKYIRELSKAESKGDKAKQMADDLFALDLTVYSSSFSFDSIIYNTLATSYIDENISLHPEQLNIINEIQKNAATIISAPTSFGKTFCIFEYIAKTQPRNVVLIVPTLALVDEYFKKIIKKYKGKFDKYKVYTNISEEKEYNFECQNMFILTHDRVVQETLYQKIDKVDFLVIDEVYKLETDKTDDRVLVLNMAYYYLAKKAEKYVLLAPFIKEVLDSDKLEKSPVFYRTDYSPVVNDVIIKPIYVEDDRFKECKNILNTISPDEKTLIFFHTVSSMYKYITKVIANEPIIENIDSDMLYFLEWAKMEIHEEWCVITALERGYLIHNGQIPVGTRIIQLDNYDKSNNLNKMLCTSTLLEGVNTTAENIIITRPARQQVEPGEHFTAFDFFNLVGRTGRLNKHLIGKAYYIKSLEDPEFYPGDAIRSIKFELTDDSEDIDIQRGNISNRPRVLDFLKRLGITLEEYKEYIGTKIRFQTVLYLFDNYLTNKERLVNRLSEMSENDQLGRGPLIDILYKICEGKANGLDSTLINKLIDKRRPTIKKIVDEVKEHTKADINVLISNTIRLKSSYIEHQFYSRILIILFFLKIDKIDNTFLEVINKKVTGAIEYVYYTNLKNKKMLIDFGIYERDIDNIIKVIGDDFEDASELKRRLVDNYSRLKKVSYLSMYIIRNLM